MENLNYLYSANNIAKVDLGPLIDLYYQNEGKLQLYSKNQPETSANLLYRHRSNKYKSLAELKEPLANYMDYVKAAFDDAEKDGIEGCYDLGIMLHGHHPNVPKRTGVGIHTHGHRNGNSVHTYTKVYPLDINTDITEVINLKEIEYEDISPPMDYDAPQSDPELDAMANQWFAWLDSMATSEEMLIKFPRQDESLTLQFNSSDWLHGTRGTSSNLYLLVIFNDYIK